MRIKRGVNAVKKRRKILKLAKGYFGGGRRDTDWRVQAVMKSQITRTSAESSKREISASCGSRVSTPRRGSTAFLTAN